MNPDLKIFESGIKIFSNVIFDIICFYLNFVASRKITLEFFSLFEIFSALLEDFFFSKNNQKFAKNE